MTIVYGGDPIDANPLPSAVGRGDVVVTLPQAFGLDTWIAEGDPAGAPWSGEEWHYYLGGSPPRMVPGDRVYVVYKGVLRGYAPLVRIERSANRFALVRHGDAVAVTIAAAIKPFRGARYRFWHEDREVPFPDWQRPDARPPVEVREPDPSTLMLLQRIWTELPRYRYAFHNEKVLHEGIAKVLTDLGIAHQREVVAGPKDRFDFLCAGGIVIEVKVDGSFAQAVEQVDRYCARPEVAAALLVTARSWGRDTRTTLALHGKPVRLAQLPTMAF